MTSKKRRMRGSRTHGGGTHKNRRGAGHRGGRGRAGRDKHEKFNYPPIGKYGFDRPKKVKQHVEVVNLRELDEDVVLLAAEGLAEETGDGYRLDARDVVEDGHEADVVKVLGTGQLHNELEVVADAFSAEAHAQLEDAGGDAVLTERGATRQAEEATDEEAEGAAE